MPRNVTLWEKKTCGGASMSDSENEKSITYAGLRRFNLVMGILHLVQGVLMIVLSNDKTYPVYTNFLKFNTETFTLVSDPQLALNLRFGPAVAIFLLLS